MNALLITANNFEDTEALYPLYRLQEEGIPITVATPSGESVEGKHGYTLAADISSGEINADDFDLLILPGGKAPEIVRLDEASLTVVKSFFDNNKVVGAICHASQILISAGVVTGRTATCYKGVKDDLIAAGATYLDQEVVVDGNLITSRKPADLPAFMREILKKKKIIRPFRIK